jgi:glutamyl-tRNA reductase
MSQNIINARITFRNSPIHILEKFTIRDIDSSRNILDLMNV